LKLADREAERTKAVAWGTKAAAPRQDVDVSRAQLTVSFQATAQFHPEDVQRDAATRAPYVELSRIKYTAPAAGRELWEALAKPDGPLTAFLEKASIDRLAYSHNTPLEVHLRNAGVAEPIAVTHYTGLEAKGQAPNARDVYDAPLTPTILGLIGKFGTDILRLQATPAKGSLTVPDTDGDVLLTDDSGLLLYNTALRVAGLKHTPLTAVAGTNGGVVRVTADQHEQLSESMAEMTRAAGIAAFDRAALRLRVQAGMIDKLNTQVPASLFDRPWAAAAGNPLAAEQYKKTADLSITGKLSLCVFEKATGDDDSA
jgi:hypothetical protein